MKKETVEISVSWFGGHYVASEDASYEDNDGIIHRSGRNFDIPSHYNTKELVKKFLRANNPGKIVKITF
jgi:hypothetical protein